MAKPGNGPSDDVVFNDEGSFYDPDDRAPEVRTDDRIDSSDDDHGEPEMAASANHEMRLPDDRTEERHPRRRRRRRRRSRRNGGGGGDFQRPGGQSNQQQRRRQDQNGQQADVPEREGAPSLGVVEGILELHPKGYGFLRDPKNNYASG